MFYVMVNKTRWVISEHKTIEAAAQKMEEYIRQDRNWDIYRKNCYSIITGENILIDDFATVGFFEKVKIDDNYQISTLASKNNGAGDQYDEDEEEEMQEDEFNKKFEKELKELKEKLENAKKESPVRFNNLSRLFIVIDEQKNIFQQGISEYSSLEWIKEEVEKVEANYKESLKKLEEFNKNINDSEYLKNNKIVDVDTNSTLIRKLNSIYKDFKENVKDIEKLGRKVDNLYAQKYKNENFYTIWDWSKENDVKIEEMIYCTIDKDEIELLLNQLNKEYKNDIKQKNKEKNRELQYV